MRDHHPATHNTNHIRKRFGVSPEAGPQDPEKITAINHEYLTGMGEALGFNDRGVIDLPHVSDMARGSEVISVPIGTHHDKARGFSGKGMFLNIYPGRVTISESDATNALKWARQQLKHYPTEDNYAYNRSGVHSLVVRVEWGVDPDNPYEVDTEPAGYGLLPHFSPRIREAFFAHRADMGNLLWTATPEAQANNFFEHVSVPMVTTESLTAEPDATSGAILPSYLIQPEDIPPVWRRQSVLPVDEREDKAYLIAMGLYDELRPNDEASYEKLKREIEDGKPKVLRGLAGACGVGLVIYKGGGKQKLKVDGKDLSGTVTGTKFLNAVYAYRDKRATCIVRDFAPATTLNDLGITLTVADEQRFGPTSRMCAIKRIYVGFDSAGKPHVLGGIISARPRTALIHGANDAINVILDPPESEGYAHAA